MSHVFVPCLGHPASPEPLPASNVPTLSSIIVRGPALAAKGTWDGNASPVTRPSDGHRQQYLTSYARPASPIPCRQQGESNDAVPPATPQDGTHSSPTGA